MAAAAASAAPAELPATAITGHWARPANIPMAVPTLPGPMIAMFGN
jgi:hypothetical protein